MRRKLTDRYIQTLKPPTSGRLVVADTEVRGLNLRVTPTGAKSWLVRYRPRKQAQKAHVAGPYSKVSLAAARRRAHAILGAAQDGRDLPAEEKRAAEESKKAAATARTVSQLADEFVENFAKLHHRKWRETEQRIRNHVLPRLGDRAAASVRRADVVGVLDYIEREKGLRAQVNRTRTTMSAMFRFALEREIVASNPVTGIRARKDAERTRTLDDVELRAIWRALDEMEEPGASFVRALMLTAARRDEVREMRWDEINSAANLWLVPAARTKTAKDHEVPLSSHMVELLAKLPRRGDFVFTVSGNRPWQGHGKFKAALDEQSGVKGWVFHDLRRTARSRFAEMGIAFEVCERLLGHAMPKLERTYDRHNFRQEKARALQAWADRLLAIVGDGHAAPNVLSMERAKA